MTERGTEFDDHPPRLPPGAAVRADSTVTLWCDRCVAATEQRVAHLETADLGAPRCAECGRWLGFACTKCGASGEERRQARRS
ncbi:hypothetical protein [Actinomadura parmotrematis]|uniref:Zinc ribbon domain-containing protein n=1 Tax=Actinomadura parmotrematis TaxID=2864039 RepID=A0ABS7FWC2_9ACTN|nr:hypothetical protein [Actinomadura parmotrematis]MBW8484731.1 hypothetical protein [Actinomadura parmotrematis]